MTEREVDARIAQAFAQYGQLIGYAHKPCLSDLKRFAEGVVAYLTPDKQSEAYPDPIEIGTVWALAQDLSQDGVTYEVTSYAADSIAYRRCTDSACMYIEPALFCRNFRRLPFRREEKFDG